MGAFGWHGSTSGAASWIVTISARQYAETRYRMPVRTCNKTGKLRVCTAAVAIKESHGAKHEAYSRYGSRRGHRDFSHHRSGRNQGTARTARRGRIRLPAAAHDEGA